jgi:uncharacterized protein YdhG (YjbR/CyaY superfamily)
MRAGETGSAGVDRYIARFPREVREILEGIRQTIKKSAAGIEEKISYQIPAFTWRGTYLVYFAAYKGHIGLYPVPKGDAAFQAAVVPYRSGKSTLRFPLDRRIPLGLIRKIVKVRMKSIAADSAKAK